MANRNRAEGWKYAKITGHTNEEKVANLTKNNKNVQTRLLECAHISNAQVIGVEYGGLTETNVDSILNNGSTKSKTDMWVHLSNDKTINVSIKKDTGGQVYLISIERFLKGYELQYGEKIPNNVKKAINLYFGSDKETEIPQIVNKYSTQNEKLINLQIRKHRLVGDNLKNYNQELYNELINWFNSSSKNLFDFCFSKGLAANKKDYADIVWYVNLVDEIDLDNMINLSDACKTMSNDTQYGTKNGGSTIQLPFGFVQWHSPTKVIPGCLQFHHNYDKIINFCKQTY